MKYWLFKEDAHSLQSSIVYALYTKALTSKNTSIDPEIIALKRQHLVDQTVVHQKFGSYSERPKNTKIGTIAKRGVSSFHDSLILKSLIIYAGSKNVLELGSSIGLNAIVLAQGVDVSVTSIDIDPQLIAIAQRNAQLLDLEASINFVNADADHFIDKMHKEEVRFDFIYIDANHTFDATIRYYEKLKSLLSQQGIMVFDDINWSKPMNNAWGEIKNDVKQGVILENYNMGIWAKNENQKASYMLDF